MRTLIANQQATNKELDVWLTSLAFIKNPTMDLMRELKVCNRDICLLGYHVKVKYNNSNSTDNF